MIPSKIFSRLENATYPCHGARLVHGSTTYVVTHSYVDRKFLVCDAYPNDKPSEYYPVPLRSIPEAPESQWEYWDEY